MEIDFARGSVLFPLLGYSVKEAIAFHGNGTTVFLDRKKRRTV